LNPVGDTPRLILALLCFFPAFALASVQLNLDLGGLKGPGFAARGVRLTLSLAGQRPASLDIAALTVGKQRFHDLHLACQQTQFTAERVVCDAGRLNFLPDLALRLVYDRERRELEIALGKEDESWRLSRRLGVTTLRVEGGRIKRFADWLLRPLPLTGGRVDATLVWQAGDAALSLEGRLREVAFSDVQGLHAGEGLALSFALKARRQTDWQVTGNLSWEAGELFWSPFYFGNEPRRLQFAGRFDGREFILDDARLHVPSLGEVTASARFDVGTRQLQAFSVATEALAVGPVYDLFVKPLMAGRLPGTLVVTGQARGRMTMEAGEPAQIELTVQDGRVAHEKDLFALEGVRLEMIWRRGGEGEGQLAAEGGRFRGLALGAFRAPLRFTATGVGIEALTIPVLDGALILSHLALGRGETGWQAAGEAQLRPVSMEALSMALGWPRMHGTVSGIVPRVRWEKDTLSMDGTLLLRVFDGTVVVKNLRVEHLTQGANLTEAEVDMGNLDLDLLTRTFSFGRMEGRVDVVVRDLALINGRPVRFSASVASSAGDYPRRISQRAVDNIAALGGGTAAPLKKTFLRVFEDFRYRRLGLAGRLADNVLTLAGLTAHDAGFVIVEGGGIPALTVIGYNRQVDWKELTERLSRIRQGASPVIR
jgi:hypothetical protein